MTAYYFNGRDVISVDPTASLKQNKNMKLTLTLDEAVVDTAQKFKKTGNQFSIFDITRKIREDVNNDVYTLVGVQQKTISGRLTFNIEHQDVRRLFLDAISQGIITNLTQNYNTAGGYNQYQEEVQPLISSSVTNTVQCVKLNPAPRPALTATTATTPTQTLGVSLPDAGIIVSSPTSTATLTSKGLTVTPVLPGYFKDTLNTYLNGRGSGSMVTMKQIQSRFDEITGVTCEEYAEALASEGYKITKPTVYPSQWYIKLW
jgi:hypothetical protein